MSEPASAIARDVFAEVGRMPAIGYALCKTLGAGSWRRMQRALTLVAAVVAVVAVRAD